MTIIQEAITAEAVKDKPGKFRLKLIDKGLGASGYYPASSLESAVTRKVFPKGTHLYMDHPGKTASEDRPERTMRDLVGVLEKDAEWMSDDEAVEADAKIYTPYRKLLEEMKDDIGMSIRASAVVSAGEADGYSGTIISELTECKSVDFVTKAGRGGRILEVLESAGNTQVQEALSQERRDQLAKALPQPSPGGLQDTWIRDFDDDARVVYYTESYAEGAKTWSQPYTVAEDDLSVTLDGERTEVTLVTTYEPVQAGQAKEAEMPQIEESRLAELTEAAGRVSVLETERDAAIKRADAAEAEAQKHAREAYATIVESSLGASELPKAALDRVRTSLVLEEGAAVPEEAEKVISEAIKLEAAYVASLTAGQKRGLGFGGTSTPTEVVESYTNPWGRTINPKEA